ncbi:MAG: ABC transporter permease [Pseudomonadota bacterium]
MSKIKLPSLAQLRRRRKKSQPDVLPGVLSGEGGMAKGLRSTQKVWDRILGGGSGAIVPRESIAGRTLWSVIAIMTFLACLTLGAVLMVSATAKSWQSDISREITVQIVPLENVNMDDALDRAVEISQQTEGVTDVAIIDWEATARLLEPWLGDNLQPDDLPVPRLITLDIDPSSPPDFDALRQALERNVPGATLDDHRTWVDRLTAMAGTTVWAGFAVLALVLAATCLTVVFATRGALAGNRQIVEVLHFVGAEDGFIALQFQRHFFALALRGVALGGAGALLVFYIIGVWVSASIATPQGDQTAAFFGQFTLPGSGYAWLVVTAFAIAALTAATARYAVHSYLNEVHEVGTQAR